MNESNEQAGQDAPHYPAPWRVDGYFAPLRNEDVWRVLSHDDAVVLQDCGESIARKVVKARNRSGELAEAVASVQARWQVALDAAHAETDRVRAHFQSENAMLIRTILSVRKEATN